jgi:energy-coupling factor transport system permease protein
LLLIDSKSRPKGCQARSASKITLNRYGRSTVWVWFVVALVLSFLAFGAKTVVALTWLSAGDMVLLIVHRPGRRFLRRMIKVMCWQVALIVSLYCLRFGYAAGWLSGLTTAWQLCLAFLPGAIFIETVPEHLITRMLTDVMPSRPAFVLATCLNFIPMIIAEAKSIYQGQVLRGARILPKDLADPRNWAEMLNCLVVPMMIHSMKLAHEIALAAKARDFGIMKGRTSWSWEADSCNNGGSRRGTRMEEQ